MWHLAKQKTMLKMEYMESFVISERNFSTNEKSGEDEAIKSCDPALNDFEYKDVTKSGRSSEDLYEHYGKSK